MKLITLLALSACSALASCASISEDFCQSEKLSRNLYSACIGDAPLKSIEVMFHPEANPEDVSALFSVLGIEGHGSANSPLFIFHPTIDQLRTLISSPVVSGVRGSARRPTFNPQI
jgi:hypothetical protein